MFTIPRWCAKLITEHGQVKVKVTNQGQRSNGTFSSLRYNFKTFKHFLTKLMYKYKSSLDDVHKKE